MVNLNTNTIRVFTWGLCTMFMRSSKTQTCSVSDLYHKDCSAARKHTSVSHILEKKKDKWLKMQ